MAFLGGLLGGLFGGGQKNVQQGEWDWLGLGGDILNAVYGVKGQVDLKKAFEQNREQNEKRYQEGLDLYGQQRNLANQQLNRAGDVLHGDIGRTWQDYMQVINSIKGNYQPILQRAGRNANQVHKGYEQAIGDVQNVGQEAARRINESGAQNLASGRARLTSRGLGNTTIGAQLDRANRQDTQRNLMDLDERVAGLRGDLRARQTDATAQARGQTNALMERRAGALSDTWTREAQAVQQQRNRLTDFMQMRPQFQANLLGQEAGFRERRTDAFNLPMYLQLMQQSSAARGGGSGGNNPLSQILGMIPSIFGLFQ